MDSSPDAPRDAGTAIGALGPRSALRRSMAPEFRYAVTVITDDPGDAARHAGGWLCDRMRAGWRVSALIPPERDPTPLQILGMAVERFLPDSGTTLLTPQPATLAFRAPVPQLPDQLATLVHTLVNRPDIEIAIWGDGSLHCARRLDVMQHRLSLAAQAFKSQALHAAGLAPSTAELEVFRSCASWYRLDAGADLEPVIGDGVGAR